MQPTSRNLFAGLSLLALFTLPAAGRVEAQTRLVVQPKSSLAWWQVNPHLQHLWATTCPQDPSWRAGEGHSMSWAMEFLSKSKTGYAAIKDTIIPLYPRRRVREICTNDAVTGYITASDTVSWRNVQGEVEVRGEALVSGLEMRDRYAHKSVLQVNMFPVIAYKIDSVAEVQTAEGGAKGDTTRAKVYGQLTLHGVTRPMISSAKVTREPAGTRIRAQFMMIATELTETWGFSKIGLGLGVGQTLWEELHMGIDVVVKPAAAGT